MTRRGNSPSASFPISEPFVYRPEPGAQGRLARRAPVAVVDIGSNSVRQVIYEGLARAPAVLFNEKVLCGLGEGVATTGRLDGEAMRRALKALTRFKALGRQAGVETTHILATAAARDATNGEEFVAAVETLFGTKVRLLTGKEEATFSAWGVKTGFHRPEGIVGDMGGGSLELVAVNGEIEGGVTLPLGGLRLAEASGGSLGKAEKIARAALAAAPADWPGKRRDFFAVGGTWRSLFKLHIASTRYPLNIIHDYRVGSEQMLAFCDRLVAKGVESFAGIGAVSRNRRALLPYGAVVMAAVIRRIGAGQAIGSSLGVREGYLYSLLSEAERKQDSLLEAAWDLCVLRSRSPRHGAELADFTSDAFAAFGMEETEDEARWRTAACFLADVGWRSHPDFRAQQGVAVITNAGFVGISHEGRAYLALSGFHRYQGLGPKVEPPTLALLASTRAVARARLLAAIFRVLYLYSASMPGVIPRLAFVARNDGAVEFRVPADLADLCGERPDERLAGLARETGRRVELKIVGN
jgi:exopolyphosphatase/guanosine-5'-triphosphate,3'-diphosphate pyrophosphatase